MMLCLRRALAFALLAALLVPLVLRFGALTVSLWAVIGICAGAVFSALLKAK